MTLSNQYPRLAWEHNPEPVHGGFIAWPHGPEGGRARVYYQRVQVDTDTWGCHASSYWWVWTVGWTERFAEHGIVSAQSSAEAKQAAADKATVAYWDAMATTEGWVTPLPPTPAPVDMVAYHFWRRVEAWMANPANFEELGERIHLYRMAVTRGPSIIDRAVDRALWIKLSDYWGRNRLNHM